MVLIADNGPRHAKPLTANLLSLRQRDITVAINVQIKIDVGLHRCGVAPSGDEAFTLVRMINERPGLTFGGILSHAGHAYSAADAAAVKVIAEDERRIMNDVAARIRNASIEVPCVSVGSTPTVWLGERFDGISEIRPGNYVFMDLTQTSLGVVSRADIALSVIATVISCNATYAIVDAGSKMLSSDRGSARLDPAVRIRRCRVSGRCG